MTQIGPLRRDIVDYIRQSCKEEHLNPPVPREYGDIPVSYEAITKEWLSATLARDAFGSTVKSFKLGPKDNGSANRRRIEIEWVGPGASELPTSVFCKAAHSAENRIVLAAGGTYSEVFFYNHIRPQLSIEAPWAYFAGYDPKSWAAMVILKDMGGETTFCNYKTSLTKAQFAEQVQMLAKLHGQYYQSQHPDFERLLVYKHRISNLIAVGLENMCVNGFKAAKSVIPPRLFTRQSEIWPCTLKSVERNAALPPMVVHGDVHLGNWYITPNGRMGLTDWQTVARGHWSRDLAYVLSTAVGVEKRRQWEHEMVEMYVSELGKHGGPKVSAQEAWLELRRQLFGVLAYWTLTLTPGENLPDMQTEEACLCFIRRICTMMDDHDVLGAF
ncbi:aminoglycoside phosphotransferase [Fusarium pseudocircinatum]|uniref:Aminoglycoside phosphotransferase n=1 Tax=Fusarium pseudocircinatum TaxID=56676 RepID=A0A8H5UWV2_9HYPO|nr:aminoglycoside phosphotransferase [Fusarium pseudocircinatum]